MADAESGFRHRAWLRHGDGEQLGPDCRHLQWDDHGHGDWGNQYPADRASDSDRHGLATDHRPQSLEPQLYRRPGRGKSVGPDSERDQLRWRDYELERGRQCWMADLDGRRPNSAR